jgi:hypothetical protein
VDATDRTRLPDCKEELFKLLQEEARQKLVRNIGMQINKYLAIDGGQSAGLEEQKRCQGSHGSG